MPIYGKKRKRVGQTEEGVYRGHKYIKRVPKTTDPGKPAPMPTRPKPKPKPKYKSIPKDHPRRIQKPKKLDDTGRWAHDIGRVPKKKTKPQSLPETGGVYRGHKYIKRVPKKKTTPGGPRNPRIGGEKYTVGR